MRRLLLICFLSAAILIGCSSMPDVPMVTAPTPTASGEIFPSSTPPTAPQILNGWQERDGQRFFYSNDIPLTGWQELDGSWYYFTDSGAMHTGFLEYEGNTYYFLSDGTMAKGSIEIDGKSYHFCADGKQILLVNPWYSVPEDHQPELVELGLQYAVEDMFVDASCFDALDAMLKECNRVCPYVCVVSAYRTHDLQTRLYENKIRRVMAAEGVDREQAAVLAAKEVAIPGTSEHQLGLAVDIVDTRSWDLEPIQAQLPAQQWLMENSWRFGFVLRYPADKTDVTGIIYEPWHYRYVGKELASELFASGLTLEEYLQNLTVSNAVG